ncbi:MAG TPA: NAD-dependent epimerase/dehydratase family protein [Nitrospirae bacterium]|nr:NAD-dependent epimerase/dehydratase family protein [Nitrospirota bacterium]
MKVLVTGATGFIGSHLVEALAGRGYSVRCLVRSSSDLRWIEALLSRSKTAGFTGVPSVELFEGDCLDASSLKDAVDGCAYVFHLAGLTKAVKEDEFFAVNAGGTENLVNVLRGSRVRLKRFIFLSSLAAVGPSINGSPVTESTEPSPVSYYGKSKLEAEKIVKRAGGEIPVTIIRPPAVYGPRDGDFLLLFKMIKRGIFPYWGRMSYSLVYVDDLINGILFTMAKESAEGKTYFISDQQAYTNEDIAAEIARILGCSFTRLRVPRAVMPLFARISEWFSEGGIINRDKMRELRHSCWICDSTLAAKELGYKSTVTLKEGIKWTADWYRINRWL